MTTTKDLYIDHCELYNILRDFRNGKISYREVVLLVVLYRGKEKTNNDNE